MNSAITQVHSFHGILYTQERWGEIRWAKEIGLYKKISRAEAKRRGIAVVPTKWVVTDKGDANRPKVRCRLVGRELRARTKGTLLAHELFTGMLPLEIFEVLLGLLDGDNVPGTEGVELEMAIWKTNCQKTEMQWVCFRDRCMDFVQQVQTGEKLTSHT